jgi:hypothetical protein
VRHLFRGTRRETGEPVEGRVTAPTEDAAHDVIRDGGIVGETLEPEPAAADDPAPTVTETRIADALKRVLDDAGFCVRYDLVTGRYQGKSTRLLDQDRIHKLVTQLLEDTAVGDLPDDTDRKDVRRRIAQALERALKARHEPGTHETSQALASQVNEIAHALERIEREMASMAVAVHRVRRGQTRAGPRRAAPDRTRDEVLLEIFESNLQLRRGLEEPAPTPAAREG